MEHITVNNNQLPSYEIRFEDDFNALHTILNDWNMKNRKVCIVTDSNVSKYYLEEVIATISPAVKEVKHYIFPAGEKSKHLDTVYEVYQYLIESSFDRKDIMIALGGGVVGDLTGYVAATYLRGIEFIQVPTTLLSMVDSSIGGKTGVDFGSYKNMVGAFHQPKLVYMNLNTLNTLNDREYKAGLAEIIKHAFIKDNKYMNWLVEEKDGILSRDKELVYSMIYTSCNIKRIVVENDPKELGERALLNFGHTLGHAIEKYKEFTLLHGECVSLGMIAASYISYKKSRLSFDDFKKVEDILTIFSLPTRTDNLNPDEILHITKSDKKMESGFLKFILLSELGTAIIDTTVEEGLLLEAIDYILQ